MATYNQEASIANPAVRTSKVGSAGRSATFQPPGNFRNNFGLGNLERIIFDQTMTNSNRFDKIFHPSDFSSASEDAYAHALVIALKNRAGLHILHVDSRNEAEWSCFPSVQETLQRWKQTLPKSSECRPDQGEFCVTKVIASSNDPVEACLDFFEVHDIDLIVLSIDQREGLIRRLLPPVSQRISAGSKLNTLFIPAGQNGFVSKFDGSLQLKNILIPVVKKPRPEASVEFVQQLTRTLELDNGNVTLLHVGSSETMPFVSYPLDGGWTWNRVQFEGERTDSILQVAENIDADLIVMTTDGPDRLFDEFRGTTSERVLGKAQCPVALIPVDSEEP